MYLQDDTVEMDAYETARKINKWGQITIVVTFFLFNFIFWGVALSHFYDEIKFENRNKDGNIVHQDGTIEYAEQVMEADAGAGAEVVGEVIPMDDGAIVDVVDDVAGAGAVDAAVVVDAAAEVKEKA